VTECEKSHIVPYIAAQREKHNLTLEERFSKPEAPPEDADAVTMIKYRLKTPEGRRIYSLRKSTVETVFGIIKSVIGFNRFLLRGLESVSGEWNLACIGYNLKRLHRLTS
jgi:hypothetical protein